MNSQFIKFIAVGILNTLFGYGVFAALVSLHLHYAMALFLATVIGVLFNFKTIGKLVFNNTDYWLFGKFLLVYGVIYIINLSLVKFLLLFSLNIYISGAITMLITALISYYLNKTWVFGRNA